MEQVPEILEFDRKFLDAADAYQDFAKQAEAKIRPIIVKMMQAYEVSAKGTSEEMAKAWAESLKEFFRPIFKVHTDLIAYVAANEPELQDIGIEPNVFAHNLGSLTLNRSMTLSSGIHIMAMMQGVGREEPRDFGHNAILPYFIPELLEQTANHLRSIVVRRKLLNSEAIDMNDPINPVEIYQTVAGSRALHEDTIPQSSVAIFEGHGISLPEKTFVNYLKIKGSPAPFEDWKSSRPVVESILYYLMSNSTKKLQKYKRAKPEIPPIVETTWYPLQFEESEFVALEVFDNGPHINADALYQALAKTLESPHQVAQGVASDTMAQLQDVKMSRQTDLTQIIPPADLPFLRGFSAQKSSGIGLNETKFLATEGGGAIMINNVYGSETGVAVTVLFPKNQQNSRGLKELSLLAEKIKTLLQTGQYTLLEAAEKFEAVAEKFEALATRLLENDRAWLRNALNIAFGLEGDPDRIFRPELLSELPGEDREGLLEGDEPLALYYYAKILPVINETSMSPEQSAMLRSLNIEPAAFQHNLSINRSGNFLSEVDLLLQDDKVTYPNLTWPTLFLPELLQQNAQHLRTVVARKQLLDGEVPVLSSGFDPHQLTHMVLASRTVFEPLVTAEMEHLGLGDLLQSEKTEEAKIVPAQIRILGEAEAYAKSTLSTDILASIVYYLVSNAGKKIADLRGPKQPGAKMEVSWSPINYEGRDYLALQVFDNGDFINTNSLYDKLVEVATDRPESLAGLVADEVLERVAKHPTDRHIDLSRLIASTDLPFFRGFSGQASTGLGLNETQALTTKGGGAVMINNVHGGLDHDSGVAVTVLIPQNLSPKDLEAIRQLTETLKDELQTGTHTLSELKRDVA